MAKYDTVNPIALKRLIAGGAKLHPFSPQILEAGFKATNEINSEAAATNANFKKVYESLMGYTATGYQWFQVAEIGYDNVMVRTTRK